MIDNDTLTVAAAAALPGLTPATVHRRIRRGMLRGYRDVTNRVVLRRRDVLDQRIEGRSVVDAAPLAGERATWLPDRLTPDEQQRGLAALARLRELHAAMLAERNGRYFSPPNWELINEARDERTRQLG